MRRLAILAVLLTGLAACGGSSDSEKSEPTTTAKGSTQIANPASQYCVSQGGKVDIVNESGGQVGYCVLPNGTRVDEWQYFNAAMASSTTAKK